MIMLRVSILTCTIVAWVTLGPTFEEFAGAQMPPAAPALSRDVTPPQPAPPALARDTTPTPRAEGTPRATPLAAKQASDAAVQASEQAGIPWWSTRNAMTMSAALLVFGLVVLLLATYLIKVGKSSEAVLRIFGTILIIVIAVFLVVAGYSDTQIAPVMGLLGTIAGYLLGKESRDKPTPSGKPETKPEGGSS